MFAVSVTYSFDTTGAIYLFNTRDEATDYIHKDIDYEIEVQRESGLPIPEVEHETGWARMTYDNGDTIEWYATTPKDRRGDTERMRIRKAYNAVSDLLDAAPAESELDDPEVTEMYAEAKNFEQSVINLGF